MRLEAGSMLFERTLKGGKGDVDGVSLRDLLFDPSLLLFLVTLSESLTSDLFWRKMNA